MFTAQDLKPLSFAAASGLAGGLALGLWLSLPASVADPPRAPDPQVVDVIDPNLAKYQQVAAAEGVTPGPYMVASFYPAVQAPAPHRREPAEAVGEESVTLENFEQETPALAWRSADVGDQAGPAFERRSLEVAETPLYGPRLAPPPVVSAPWDSGAAF